MQAKITLLGHPVHQMLIVFPLGLLATAVLFDVIHLVSNNDERFLSLAYWLIVSGIVGGLVAAPFGTLDWLKIPAGTRAKRIGAMHGLGNVVVLALFAVSALLRTTDLAVGVDDDAHLNAPSSLTDSRAAPKVARAKV